MNIGNCKLVQDKVDWYVWKQKIAPVNEGIEGKIYMDEVGNHCNMIFEKYYANRHPGIYEHGIMEEYEGTFRPTWNDQASTLDEVIDIERQRRIEEETMFGEPYWKIQQEMRRRIKPVNQEEDSETIRGEWIIQELIQTRRELRELGIGCGGPGISDSVMRELLK